MELTVVVCSEGLAFGGHVYHLLMRTCGYLILSIRRLQMA